ncbi:heme exporter protein CcmD [uncultured Nitrosomonas sp.]|uniref:heme exporter protein CcmD n=1 Tax=uncultured Nitrosomonas sp. TaxID=156424 RepID=UPI0034265EC7
MKWESMSDFFAMGGYGLYVWGSYLVAMLCIIGEIVLIRIRKRTLYKYLGLRRKSILRGEK